MTDHERSTPAGSKRPADDAHPGFDRVGARETVVMYNALAYVLAQPFPSIPLIGPRRLEELDDSIKALSIKLTPDQVKWLENG